MWSNHFRYDFIRLSHWCGGILTHFFATLIQVIEACGHLFKSRPWGLDFDWIIATPWFFCWSLSFCMAQFWQFWHIWLQNTLVHKGVYGRFSDCNSCGCKTTLNHHPLHHMAKHLHFGLVCPEDIVAEVSWFVEMQLCNLIHAAKIFLERRDFLLATLPSKPALFSLFLIVL